jgi:hypothetical protein
MNAKLVAQVMAADLIAERLAARLQLQTSGTVSTPAVEVAAGAAPSQQQADPGGGGDAPWVLPALSSFSSFKDLWSWYTQPLSGHDQTVQDLCSSRDTAWRQGPKQRWCEIHQLLRVIKQTAEREGIEESAAAVLVDVEWKRQLQQQAGRLSADKQARRSLASY